MNQLKPWVNPLHVARPRPPAQAEPPTIIIDEPEPIYCGSGLWQKTGQWRLLQKLLPEYLLRPIEMPGHSPDDQRPVSLNDWVKTIRKQVRMDVPISVIAHSAGVAAFQKFENQWPEQISDMVMLAGSPLKTVGNVVPAVPKQLRFVKYLWKLLRNKQFRLSAEDERFVRGGIAVNFGVESGLVAKEILFQLESVEPVQCPSLVLAAMHDQFYPRSKGIQEAIAKYNGSVYAEVNGSHMFHCDPVSAAEIAQHIRAWRSSFKSEPQHRRKVAA